MFENDRRLPFSHAESLRDDDVTDEQQRQWRRDSA